MTMKTLLPILLAGFAMISCNKEKYFDGPDTYSDGFESYSQIDQLLEGENQYWSFFQKTYPGNALFVDTLQAHTGQTSIRCVSVAPDENQGTSKCSVSKQKMAFYEGETVHADMWYYLEGTDELDWLFLFDLEEQASIGAGPGMRLAVVDNQLRVEHKFNNPDIVQPTGFEKNIPRNTWFKISFETLLSQKKDGYVKVWQNDTLIIDQANWNTQPRDNLYFQQGTKGIYSSIEFGVTANSTAYPVTLYVDDISVKVIP